MYELWDTDTANMIMYEKDKLRAATQILELVVLNGSKDLALGIEGLPGKDRVVLHDNAVVQWANAVISLAEQGRIE